jgi:hypothetical protein
MTRIDIPRDGRFVQWVIVEDGRIILHTENDGDKRQQRGPEPIDDVVTLKQIVGLAAKHPKLDLVRRIEAALGAPG